VRKKVKRLSREKPLGSPELAREILSAAPGARAIGLRVRRALANRRRREEASAQPEKKARKKNDKCASFILKGSQEEGGMASERPRLEKAIKFKTMQRQQGLRTKAAALLQTQKKKRYNH